MSNLHDKFITAYINGDIEQVDYAIKNGISDCRMGLNYACQNGHRNIVELLLPKITDFINPFYHACIGGHIDIIELLISKGAADFNGGLHYTCLTGDKEVALLMISKGANINKCKLILKFEDIYYLLQKDNNIRLGKYEDIGIQCQKWKSEFHNTIDEFFIKDIANIIVEY